MACVPSHATRTHLHTKAVFVIGHMCQPNLVIAGCNTRRNSVSAHALRAPVVEVGTARQEVCGDRKVAPDAGQVERRGAVHVAGVDVCACSADERSRDGSRNDELPTTC